MTRIRLFVFLAALTSIACGDRLAGPVRLEGDPGQSVTVDVGADIRIHLGTLGPGMWDTAGVSTTVVRFISDTVLPSGPGGPQQQFRFSAVAAGVSVLTFRHTYSQRVVKETVEVRSR
jgi:hypothetical protein